MKDPIEIARARSLPRLRRRLLRGSPRLAVAAMLASTTLAGFLCSVALLHLGVHGMGLRYAVSVLVAYGVFLAQLRIWVALARRRESRGADLDVPDLSEVADAAEVAARWVPGGGRFAGGGASGSFDPRSSGLPSSGVHPTVATNAGSSAGDAVLDVGFDLDGWQVVAIAALVAIVACAGVAAGYLVYTAPALLAEVLFDGAVAGVLYRRLRRGAPRAWWQGALSRTWVPAVTVLFFFGVGGLVLEQVVPGARSIGEVLRAVSG